jgi:hypothetical protein
VVAWCPRGRGRRRDARACRGRSGRRHQDRGDRGRQATAGCVRVRNRPPPNRTCAGALATTPGAADLSTTDEEGSRTDAPLAVASRDAFGDLFQIAVTAAWMLERDGEPIRNPRAFLFQVIVNQRKMQLRSERRHPATSYDELAATVDSNGGAGIDAIADRRPSVSEQVERRDVAMIVTHILRTVERQGPHGMASAISRDVRRTKSSPRLASRPASTPGCSSARIPRSTASSRRTSPATGAPAMRRSSRGSPRIGGMPADAHDGREHLHACPSCPAVYETFTRLHASGA